jgi:hypothetical protein
MSAGFLNLTSTNVTSTAHAAAAQGGPTVVYLLPQWVYLMFYGMIGGFVILLVLFGVYVWGMGEFRQFWFYKGDIALESNGDGTRELYKADRELSVFLRLRNKKLEHPLRLAKPGTALSKSGRPTFYVTHARYETAVNLKEHQYGHVLQNKRAGLLDLKNAPKTIPVDALDAVVEWKKEQIEREIQRRTMPEPLSYQEYVACRIKQLEEVEQGKRKQEEVLRDFSEQDYVTRIKMLKEENEAQLAPLRKSLLILEEIRTGRVQRTKADGTLEDPISRRVRDRIVKGILREIQSQPEAVWPAEIGGEAIDLRDLAASNLFGVAPEDIDKVEQIAEKKAARKNRGTERFLILLFAIIALIMVGGIVLAILHV